VNRASPLLRGSPVFFLIGVSRSRSYSSSEPLFERTVAVGLIPTENSSPKGRQHATESVKLVFASGHHSGTVRKREFIALLSGNHIEHECIAKKIILLPKHGSENE
jgi:hypothetical protein